MIVEIPDPEIPALLEAVRIALDNSRENIRRTKRARLLSRRDKAITLAALTRDHAALMTFSLLLKGTK